MRERCINGTYRPIKNRIGVGNLDPTPDEVKTFFDYVKSKDEYYDILPGAIEHLCKTYDEDEAAFLLIFAGTYREVRGKLQATRVGRDQKVFNKAKPDYE